VKRRRFELRTSWTQVRRAASHIHYVLSRDIQVLGTAGLTANRVQSCVSTVQFRSISAGV